MAAKLAGQLWGNEFVYLTNVLMFLSKLPQNAKLPWQHVTHTMLCLPVAFHCLVMVVTMWCDAIVLMNHDGIESLH